MLHLFVLQPIHRGLYTVIYVCLPHPTRPRSPLYQVNILLVVYRIPSVAVDATRLGLYISSYVEDISKTALGDYGFLSFKCLLPA